MDTLYKLGVRVAFPVVLLLAFPIHAHAQENPTVVTGTIKGWPQSGYIFNFDDHVGVTTRMQAWWSISQIDPGVGYVYGFDPAETHVARAPGVTKICQITDASSYTYTDPDTWGVGAAEGEIVLFHNTVSGYYGAVRVDDIYGSDVESAQGDFTWYVQEDGGDNFGPCPPGWEEAYEVIFESPSDLDLFRDFRDQILCGSLKGRIFKSLLYRNSEASLRVLLDNPELMGEAKQLVGASKGVVAQALQGDNGVLRDTREVHHFLDRYARKSPLPLDVLVRAVQLDLLVAQYTNKLFCGLRVEEI